MTSTTYFKTNVLNNITYSGKTVKFYYCFPDDFKVLPVGSYRLASRIGSVGNINNNAKRETVEYYVSIFGKSPKQIEDISKLIEAKAKSEKFIISFCQDIKEVDDLYYRREYRFKANYNPLSGNLI